MSSSESFVSLDAGVYEIELTDANDCSFAIQTRTVNDVAVIESIKNAFTMDVFPNPTNGLVNVTLGINAQNAFVNITNALGQNVLSKNMNFNNE